MTMKVTVTVDPTATHDAVVGVVAMPQNIVVHTETIGPGECADFTLWAHQSIVVSEGDAALRPTVGTESPQH